MRILHYFPGLRLADGGVVRSIIDWCTVLAARGHEIILATFDSPDAPKDWDGSPGKPKIVWLPGSSIANWKVPAEAVEMFERLLTPGSVVHLHTPWMASNMQMSRVCRNHGVPYVVSIHGMLDDWSMAQRGLKKRIFLALGARRHLAAADCLQYTAAGERDQAQKWVPGARPTILAPIIDLSPYQQLTSPELARKRFSISADVPLLAFVSRLHPKKGVEILIDAADLLRKRGLSFKVIIAGAAAEADRDYETKLREQVTRLNLTDFVQFAGLVTGTEKISLYQAAELFVLPTHQENFGLVLIEAMACGTPVLTTRGTDIWQEIAAGGATISENNPQAMHQAIVQLLDDPALEAIGRRGREWVLERFAIDTIALGFEKMYSDALTRAGRN